jgi:hypothetical protein
MTKTKKEGAHANGAPTWNGKRFPARCARRIRLQIVVLGSIWIMI